jgi:adenylate kinase
MEVDVSATDNLINNEVTPTSNRTKPNILITGTPGTGKTSLSEAVATQSGMQHIDVGKLVGEKSLHDGRDEELDCWILNEDKV